MINITSNEDIANQRLIISKLFTRYFQLELDQSSRIVETINSDILRSRFTWSISAKPFHTDSSQQCKTASLLFINQSGHRLPFNHFYFFRSDLIIFTHGRYSISIIIRPQSTKSAVEQFLIEIFSIIQSDIDDEQMVSIIHSRWKYDKSEEGHYV